MQKVNLFGIKYAVTDYQHASMVILENAIAVRSYSVFALPVHGVVESRRDEEFMGATQRADMIVPDGQPIRWAMNYFHKTQLKDRVYGPRLMNEVLKKANAYKLRIFLYGGSTSKVLDDFISYIVRHYPDLVIVGSYREEVFGRETIDLDLLKASKPAIVLVGLGCPTQEKWIARNQSNVGAVMMGVGAAFGFYSGATKMAPKWMQDRGLEWFYRLCKEPRRLWRRYFYYNTYYVGLVIKKMLGMS